MGQVWVSKFRKQRRISSWFYGWDGALPTLSCLYIIHERFRCPKESLAGLLGSGVYPLARGKQDTLNEYHTKTIHVGQSTVFQRKNEMLFLKEGGMDAGQAKTTDVHCSRSIWCIFDEPKDQKLCKDTCISLSLSLSLSLSHTHTHTHTHTDNSVLIPRESPPHLIDFIPLWFTSCFSKKMSSLQSHSFCPVSHITYLLQLGYFQNIVS